MLDITLGHESAILKSQPVDDGVALKDGEWAVYNKATGKLIKQAGTFDPATQGLPVIVYGNNVTRFDSKGMDAVTVAFGKQFYGTTDMVAAVTIAPGDPLTIVDGKLAKAAKVDNTVVAYAVTPSTTGVIEFVRGQA